MRIINQSDHVGDLCMAEEEKLWLKPPRTIWLRAVMSASVPAAMLGILGIFASSGMSHAKNLPALLQAINALVAVGSLILCLGFPLFLLIYLLSALAYLHDSLVAPDYAAHRAGLEGQRLLPQYLASLDNQFCLINGVQLPGMRGDIDHVLVGPPGVFALETKHHRGQIICNGDV